MSEIKDILISCEDEDLEKKEASLIGFCFDEKNARLCAAAPEMYKMLKRLFCAMNNFSDIVKTGMDAKQLLARIDGKQETQK